MHELQSPHQVDSFSQAPLPTSLSSGTAPTRPQMASIDEVGCSWCDPSCMDSVPLTLLK